jgi:hypothetical protein
MEARCGFFSTSLLRGRFGKHGEFNSTAAACRSLGSQRMLRLLRDGDVDGRGMCRSRGLSPSVFTIRSSRLNPTVARRMCTDTFSRRLTVEREIRALVGEDVLLLSRSTLTVEMELWSRADVAGWAIAVIVGCFARTGRCRE